MKCIFDARDKEEVMSRILRVRPDSTRRWGRMSAHQMVCHLADSFAATLGDRAAVHTDTFFTRTVMRFMAANVPLPWPRGVRTMPEVDQERDGTPPAGFAADLERLDRVVDGFVTRLDHVTMRHPFLGPMSRGEWGRWAYRHVDHHARQFGL
jgi:hypothetical protein